MPTDYTNEQKFWEAWAGGFGGYSELSENVNVDLDERIVDFYGQVVGPAFGGGYDADVYGEDFGETYRQYIHAFDMEDFEAAERQFKLSIGDPYIYGDDPFAWERVSRMDIDQAGAQLEAELFGQGKNLGGKFGSEYGISMSKGLEDYTTGLTGARESLTYEGLEEGQGLLSGTSGAVLRSGESQIVAEDTLIEAYKTAKNLQTDYAEGKAATEIDLEGNLNDALNTYLAALKNEKDDWFDIIAGDVLLASTKQGMEYKFLGEQGDCNEGYVKNADDVCVLATSEPAIGGDWADPEYETGLEYADEDWTLDEACGIGFVKVEDENGEVTCKEAEGLGYTSDKYGELCPSGIVDCDNKCDGTAVIDECGVCTGGDTGVESACIQDCAGEWGGNLVFDECDICGGDGIPEGECDCDGNVEDECGECGGFGIDTISGYCDCDRNREGCDGVCGSGAIEDECGECGGPGPQYLCPQDGELVCEESECEYETPPNCPEGTEWNGTYSNDPGNMCNPIGDVEVDLDCPPDQEQISFGGYDFCMDIDWEKRFEDDCDDGSERPPNGVCPEDLEGDCPCVGVEEFDEKLCVPPGGEGSYESGVYANPNCYITVYRRNCLGDPQHGTICGSKGDVTTGGGAIAGG